MTDLIKSIPDRFLRKALDKNDEEVLEDKVVGLGKEAIGARCEDVGCRRFAVPWLWFSPGNQSIPLE